MVARVDPAPAGLNGLLVVPIEVLGRDIAQHPLDEIRGRGPDLDDPFLDHLVPNVLASVPPPRPVPRFPNFSRAGARG